MKTSPVMQVPYPEATDGTNTWEYWQAIAERIDGIWQTSLANGSDLNTITSPGVYIAVGDSTAASIANWPVGVQAYSGALEVFAWGGLVVQRVTEFIRATHLVWERTSTGTGWSPWRPIGGLGPWVTSALTPNTAAVTALGAAGGRAASEYGARFASGLVEVSGQVTMKDAGGSGGSVNFGDILICSLAAPFRPGYDPDFLIVDSGTQTFFGRLYTNGDLMITHGTTTNQTWAAGRALRFTFTFPPAIA